MAVMGLRLAGRANGVAAAARRGQPRDVRRPVARRAGATRCRSARSPTASTRHTWVGDHIAPLLAQERRHRCGTAPTRPRGPASTRHRPGRGVGRARQGPRRAGRVRARAPRRRAARPEGAHHRLRPPLRHLQARHAAARRSPSACAALLLDRRPAGAVRVRRQGPPGRRAGQGDDPRHRAVRPPARRAATASCSSPTTTWPSPA